MLATASCARPEVSKEAVVFYGPVVDYQDYGDRLTFRTESRGSPVLLFRAHRGSDVFRYEPDSGPVTTHPLGVWERATGGVADEMQTWVPTAPWVFDPPSLSFDGAPVATVGKHHLSVGRSFDGAYVAVVSADGRYRELRGGLFPFLGGRPAWAGGDHFHQVFDHRTGSPVGDPVRIPLSSRDGSIRVSWTLDNQYVVYNASHGSIAIAATGIPGRDVVSAHGAIEVYQPTGWKAPWYPGLQLRYLDSEGDTFVLRHVRESVVYRYDRRARELGVADSSLWDDAPGDPWDDFDLKGFGSKGRKTLDTSDNARLHRLTEEEAGRRANVIDFYWQAGRLTRFGKELETVGGKPERLSLSPRLNTALVFSSDEAGAIYQERYSLPSGNEDGEPLKLPATIRDAPYVLWTPDERYILFWDAQRSGLLYVQFNGEMRR